MKEATLALIRDRGLVFLPKKKTGEIGKDLYNGPGGKLKTNETPLACVIRETWEETRMILVPSLLDEAATITCYAAGVPDFRVYVYLARGFLGTPKETRDAVPAWFHWSDLPFDRMHDADRYWMPRALGGQRFSGDIFYRERGVGFEKFVPKPFTSFPKEPC